MENVTRTRVKGVCKDFEIEKLGEYPDLYVPNQKLFLEDVFENFRNMYLEIYELNPTGLLTTLLLAYDYDKNKELSYLQYWDVNNLNGWVMLQKPPINNFDWIEETS